MQGLVHIGLGHGDIILKPAGNGLIQLMDHSQGPVAVLDRIHDDPDRKHVVDLFQGLILLYHLFIDAEEMLDPSVNSGLDAAVPHVSLHFFYNTFHKSLSGLFTQGDLFL